MSSTPPAEGHPTPRPLPLIRAELDEVRRHLVDAPPHHGAGVRDVLQRRLRNLEAEHARAVRRTRS